MKIKLPKQPGVASPCISVCAMNEETGYCRGCFRTLKEITDWQRYDDTQKREVTLMLERRRHEQFHPRDC